MNNKVEALVEFVARHLACVFDNDEEWNAIPDKDSMDAKTKWEYLQDAREILSYPDLAFIDSDIHSVLCGNCDGSGKYSYDASQDCPYCHGQGVVKQKIESIIPLTEALRED